MFLPSVVYMSISFILGTTFAGEESKVTVKHLDPDKGTAGYDLFYYDGESLRDEKWRFDPKTGSTVVSRRNGFREKDNFHLVDATLDALGSFTKSYKMRNEPGLIKDRVREPQTHRDSDNEGNVGTKTTNGFSGISFNTQYATQNGFPHVSEVVGIEQLNAPNLFNGLNFQQAFSTAGFGFQQHGSVFNHQTQLPSNQQSAFQNNHNFQLSTFLMPFFNQHNNNHNQHQPFGSFASFGNYGTEMGHEHAGGQPVRTSTIQSTAESTTIQPILYQKTTTTRQTTTRPTTTAATTTTTTSTTTTTTPDPTLNFDVRLEKDAPIDETATQSIQTTSRRPVEGLPSSDEDYAEVGGILDDKINPKVLLSAVG